MKNSFCAISIKYICILDSYFIHRYIMLKYISSSIKDKIHRLLAELCPLISVRTFYHVISFENIDVLDSYFIQMYIIMKYWSNLIKDKIH